MQIKRFEAQDMNIALRLIKQEFGSEAVILSARNLKREKGVFGLFKKPGVVVTAATDTPHTETLKKNLVSKIWKPHPDQSDQVGFKDLIKKKSLIKSVRGELGGFNKRFNPFVRRDCIPNTDTKGLFILYQKMLAQGLEERIALELIKKVNNTASSKKILKVEELRQCLIPIVEKLGIIADQIKMENGKKKTVAFIGPTGVGKTTTIAKLAAVQALHEKKQVALITLDNYRIAAIAQLKTYANIIGVPIEVASNKKEFKGSLKKLGNRELILIDTAGMSQVNKFQIDELKDFFSNISSIEIHLLLSATTKENDLMDILERFSVMSITSVIFTKLDETTTYGTILNQLFRTKIPISYFTNGQQVPEDIEAATSEKLVDLITNQKEQRRHWSGSLEILHSEDRKENIHNAYWKGFYVVNKNSDIFHFSNCKCVKKIKTENMIVFESRQDALKKDFKPCKLCRPDKVEKYRASHKDWIACNSVAIGN